MKIKLNVSEAVCLLELQGQISAKIEGPSSPLTNWRVDDLSVTALLPAVAYCLAAEVC